MSQDAVVSIVIVGAVDHGKSTFIGRLLVDTQQLTPDRLADLEEASRELNQPVEYAHVTDQFQEERAANITIDTTQTRFRWNDRIYILIDAPGHREYLANMITGASRARHALLMLDVNEGVRAQTEKHADILKLLGVERVAVLMNKMDLVGYQESVYNQHRALIEETLSMSGLKAAAIIPLAAYHGENVAKKSDKMPWYQGPTALEFIAASQPAEASLASVGVRFPVQLTHDVEGARLALGRIEEGTLRENQSLKIFPSGKSVRVKSLRVHGQPSLTSAGPGFCIGLEVDDASALHRGAVLCEESGFVKSPSAVSADVFWASTKPLKTGDEVTLECRTQTARGRIEKMVGETPGENLSELGQGGLARVRINLSEPILIQPHVKSDIFGRVVFNREGEAVGCGVVAELD